MPPIIRANFAFVSLCEFVLATHRTNHKTWGEFSSGLKNALALVHCTAMKCERVQRTSFFGRRARLKRWKDLLLAALREDSARAVD